MSAPLDVEMPVPPKQDPEALVLRGRPRQPIRFRRSVIVGGTGALAALLITAAWIALEPRALRIAASGQEPPSSGSASAEALAEALAGAPRSYSDVPRLGPPLPGDLGRPIVARQRQLEIEADQPRMESTLDGAADAIAPERERLLAAELAARKSAVLVQRAVEGSDRGPAQALVAPADEDPAKGSEQQPDASTDQQLAAARPTSVVSGRSPPATGNSMLQAGTIIPASLITGLNSDLPGAVIAQVTENVRDSVDGTEILIPQGARLIGAYDSRTSYAQKRALLVWERLLLPDGSSVDLGKMPATDTSGYAGLRDSVDSHGWELLKGVALASVLSIGSELSIGGNSLVRAVRQSLQQNGSRAGEQIVGRSLDVRPTLTVKPGWPVRVLVTRDLPLKAWRADEWER